MINLGDKCRDQVTGFEGIATARVEFINGCVRYCLEALKDGSVEELYFDDQRLAVVDPELTQKIVEAPAVATGGSRATPPRTGAR